MQQLRAAALAVFRLSITVFLLSLATVVQCDLKVFPSEQLSIMEGAGFLAYLDAPLSTRWIHCSVQINGQSYSLDSDQVHTVGGKTTVERFDTSRCGLRVMSLQKSLESSWLLYGTDEAGLDGNATLKLTVLSIQFVDQLNITATGTSPSVTVRCPDGGNPRHCRIIDSEQNVYEVCSKYVEINEKHSTFWCHSLFWGDMTERITKINVHVQEDDSDVKATIEETDTHVVLSCHYRRSVSLCRAHSETDNRQMMLMDGTLADRYSSYDTKINAGICSLEIKKPLIPGDIGLWRIYQHISPNDHTGCVFDLGKKLAANQAVRSGSAFIHTRTDTGSNRHQEQLQQINPTRIEIFHDPRSSTTTQTQLTCEVPYALQYCYLSGPTTGDYAPQRFDYLKSLGQCRFDVANITAGTWACGINDEHGAEDHLTYYDVRVYEQPARVVTGGTVTASIGDRKERLLCKTILDLPIDLCRFLDPAGEVHGLSDMMKPSSESRFRYHGAGLREGECGLEIAELEEKDFGRWKCLLKVRNREYEIPMDVVEEALSVGAIVGICLAGTIVLMGIGFFVYRRMNRRYSGPSYTVSSSMTNVSNGSHQS
ncbi:uncharacterized protein LOC125958385 isoform X1 [Anopheles darlingi]|uniref:uncharacterized protein LOC125958385 isoform X1 n=1 Tax=Anopheles darlingi TaxID=43151 RepID=UPI00210048BC|nr:uncharacterized protein LOC125958385 isoform X1 [Anopheles darlingi]XP_049547635.1 uncharacterized protein LOC125958385 isoform X1 [Anopheles darlingi]